MSVLFSKNVCIINSASNPHRFLEAVALEVVAVGRPLVASSSGTFEQQHLPPVPLEQAAVVFGADTLAAAAVRRLAVAADGDSVPFAVLSAAAW